MLRQDKWDSCRRRFQALKDRWGLLFRPSYFPVGGVNHQRPDPGFPGRDCLLIVQMDLFALCLPKGPEERAGSSYNLKGKVLLRLRVRGVLWDGGL